jgi:hypothetical protein
MIGTIISGILDQLRDIYSICRCCWNVTERYILHMQVLLECNVEIYTPYAGAAGM